MKSIVTSAAVAAALIFASPAGADHHEMSRKAEGVLPPVETRGPITFLTGGVGDREQAAIREKADEYKLALTLTRPDGAYLADVRVVIEDAEGATLLDTTTKGPFLLANLPAGRYAIRAELEGHQQERRTVDVPKDGHVSLFVSLPASN